MAKQRSYEDRIAAIKTARAHAIEHTRLARQYSSERRELMASLIEDGWSQATIARELGVSRQAIQKMLSM